MARATSLSKKQKAFALAFARTDNLTQSAKTAGYSGSSLRKPGQILTENVMELVKQHRKRLASLIDIREVSIMRELGRLSMSRITDALGYLHIKEIKDDNGELTSISVEVGDMPDDVKAQIKRIRVRPTKFGTEIDVEMHDKLGSLRLLAQIKSMMEAVKQPPRIQYNTTVVAQNAQVNNGPKRLASN